jgi:hypothetical protein
MKFIISLFTAGILAGCGTIESVTNIEEPAYKLLRQDGDFELREYNPMIIAEVTVRGTLDEASGRGFRLIADYIFGNNLAKSSQASEKIAMTAPVTMTREGEKIAMTAPVTMTPANSSAQDAWRMHFVMPSRYTMATLPTPKNSAVKLREVKSQKVAALRFSGFSGEEKVTEKTGQLNEWMSKSNLSAGGVPQLARYNMPLTPPPFRRNEILIPLTAP